MRFCVRAGRPALDETDPELLLTDEQQAAVRPGREVVLEAGAGAGKTHTLALRYVALLVDVAWTEDAVERVLVLTFTEKAADEMAERCRRRLAEAAACAQIPLPGVDADGQRRQAENLRRMVDRFERARIGTFHGFCARLLREFPSACRTPVGVEVLDAPEARAWTEEALQDALDDLVRNRPADLGPLLDALGSRGNLLGAGRAAVEARGALRAVLEDHATGRDRLSELVASAPVSAEEARTRIAAASKDLGLLLRLVAPSGGGPFAETVRTALADPPDLADPLVAWARYRELMALPLNARGDLRSLDHPTVLGLKEAWPDQRRYTQAREGAKVLAQRMADWPARHQVAKRLPTPADRTLLEALVPFSRWVLDALGRLDRRLDEERRVTFDLMQQRAVDAVLRDPGLRAELRRRHRYLVVDEFQDTDERQWSLVRALARQHPDEPEDRVFVVGDPKQAIYGFRGGDVTVFRTAVDELGVTPDRLSRNFRSGAALVRWFNELFPSVLVGGARWEASYEPVVPAAAEGGEVELLRVADGDDAAAVLASHLAEALAPGSPLLDRTRYPVPPIAVLLRSRTRQHRVEAELRRRRIPYVVAQGVGFWARPEVLDLANALAAAATFDTVATVGWLRSPLCGADDDEVQALGPTGIVALARGEVPGTFGDRLAALRDELRTVPPSEWLRRRVREALPVWVQLTPEGRAEANARRLVDLCRPRDDRGPHGVAAWMLGEIRAEQREGEVLATPSAARVLLATVHASKGLEFPWVVVPELDARTRGQRGPLLAGRDEDWQIAFRVQDETAVVQTRVKPGRYEALAELTRAQEDAEERRLLYVACTRARDRLVLVGRTRTTGDATAFPTWMQLIDRALPRSTRVLRGQITDRVLPSPHEEPDGQLPEPPRVPRRPALELAASALDRFVACPARFWLLDLQGRPEPAPPTRDRATRLAGLRGRVLHELLEEGVHDPSVATRRFHAAAAEEALTEEETTQGLARTVDQLQRTLALPEVRTALAAPGGSEVPFRVAHGGVVLRGRIDRLFRGEAGDHVVLDWKTEARPRDDHDRQLLAYAWAATALGLPTTEGWVVYTAVGRLDRLGPWSDADRAQVPALLEAVRSTAERPWVSVLEEATSRDRPCASCGFRGRTCPGVG
ncbi:MAG: UvrD-helicase domain-containing protein [Alphaproteobacteria bacterium]|nr:UvrD-helicase domain-containing protein [Alphaproteobacteria bacterium]MCB9696620.1 UvrD-helicase domain-containing protein [Alphaproteobacteria bacterium]